MKHFSEYLNESINHVYTLEFGKNEDLSSGNGTRFKVEFVDVIDCKKRMYKIKNRRFKSPINYFQQNRHIA